MTIQRFAWSCVGGPDPGGRARAALGSSVASVDTSIRDTATTRLPAEDYLQHLTRESERFRAVLAGCAPDAPVPSCPGWTAADLLWHVAGSVHDFWNHVVRTRPAAPEDWREPDRPPTYEGLLAAFDRTNAAFLEALAAADPGEPAWSWSDDHTVGFTLRRQAHEILIHRLDAELTAGTVTPLDPVLAADGVHEVLAVMYGGTPAWGRFDPGPGLLRVDLPDTDTSVWVRLGTFTGTAPDGTTHAAEPDLDVVPDPGVEPDVLVEGLAGEVDAWLWRRRDDSGIHVVGDGDVYARFRACVDQAIS